MILPKGAMSIIKLEVRIPEMRKALEAFARNRKQALDLLTGELREVVSSTLNQMLNAEIDVFLGAPEQTDNKRNGYLPEREYAFRGIGCVRIRVPKDRKGRFESIVIPPHEKADPRLRADMAILHLAGISTRMLSMISKRLLGIEVSKDAVTASLDLVRDEAEKWLTRPISARYWALYVDGTNFKVQRRGTTEREPLLVVLGIDENNHRSVLAIEPGTRDDVNSWRAVFRSLKERGLETKHVRIGIMDGLSGLESLFKDEFTNATTGRCWRHAMGNALAKSPARFREAFKLQATKVMKAPSEDAARADFIVLKEAFDDSATRAVACLEKDLESLLVHYRFEKRFWRALRTTNPIERINKEFKRRTNSMETIGGANLMSVVAFVALRLEMGWQLKAVDAKEFDKLGKKRANVIEKTVEQIGLLN